MILMDVVAESLVKQWNFVPTEELPGGHCSRVYADSERVLKVPFQGEEMDSGYWAILALEGPFKPIIFASDPETGSLLIERAIPGLPLNLTGLTETEQLKVWSQVVDDWRKCPKQGFMALGAFSDPNDPLAQHLLSTTQTKITMHGDLHYFNILSHKSGWLCIDAKGVIGDPAFEGAAYVRNPLPSTGDFTTAQIAERVNQVADALGVDPFRVWGWSVIMLRDGGNPEPGPWRNVLDRLYQCAAAFGAKEWLPI